MRILLDENLPLGLRQILAPSDVVAARDAGLCGVKNGDLLAAAEGAFDVLITADKNLRYQQNLRGRNLAIVELPTNRWPLLRRLRPEIAEALQQCRKSAYIIVSSPAGPASR